MTRIIPVLLLVAVLTPQCLADDTDNVQIVTAMIDAINARDLDNLAALVS